MSIFSRSTKPPKIRYGDKVVILEGMGGRPSIAGDDPIRTQENLMRAVKGLPFLNAAGVEVPLLIPQEIIED